MSPLILAVVAALVLQQPTFRSGVDLLRVDVAVVDDQGHPVRNLRPEDFVVTVDGVPRRVGFAQFYGPDETPRAASDVEPVSTATNLAAPKGRVLVLVVDIDSIIPGKEKLIFDTAARLVDRLGPADAVGLLVLPGKGVEITRNHDSVRQALATLRGAASPPPHGYRMSVSEAEAFRYHDGAVIQDVMIRECRPADAYCGVQLQQLATSLLVEADRRTRLILPALTTLFSKLELIEAPRGVVLLSAGFQRSRASDVYIRDLEKRANTAGVRMSIVQIEQTQNDASFRLGAGGGSRGDLAEGLGAIGGATDGEMYFGIGQAAGAFERIGDEIVHSYELGIESAASDGDGRTHRLRIDVKRRGVTVRSRKEFVVNTKPRPASNPVEVLSNPIDFAEAPMAVSTYTTRGDEPSTLKVLVLVEGLTAPAQKDVQSYAVSISDGQGTATFETAGRFGEGQSSTAIGAQLAPGRYRLRAALIDAGGRRGSLEMPIVVGLRPVGSLQFSDLIIGAAGAPIPVTSRAAAGSSLAALLEMLSADPAQLDGLTATIEARRPGDSGPPARVAADVRKTATDRRRFAVAEIPADSLRPGTWIVSAIVRRGEAVVGQVSRTIVVEPPR